MEAGVTILIIICDISGDPLHMDTRLTIFWVNLVVCKHTVIRETNASHMDDTLYTIAQ